jgi:hypothetical protein
MKAEGYNEPGSPSRYESVRLPNKAKPSTSENGLGEI